MNARQLNKLRPEAEKTIYKVPRSFFENHTPIDCGAIGFSVLSFRGFGFELTWFEKPLKLYDLKQELR